MRCSSVPFVDDGHKGKLGFIQLGKPTQNAFVESLNGKFRNECLNTHWFKNLEDAQRKIISVARTLQQTQSPCFTWLLVTNGI